MQGRLRNSLAVHTQSMKINKAFSKALRKKKKVDELKGGFFFFLKKTPPYPDLALSRILLKAGEEEHVLGNLDCGSFLAFS